MLLLWLDVQHCCQLKVAHASLAQDTGTPLHRLQTSLYNAEATRDALAYAQHAMKLDLEFLEHGGSIEQLPHDLEELELNTLPQGSVEEFKEATERQPWHRHASMM